MATYSLAFMGTGAHNPFSPKRLTMDDAYATPGAQAGAMSQGTVITCQNQAGIQQNYKIDAERSDPSRGLIFLIRQ